MTPQYGAVTPSTFKIAGESINALMLYQHKGDNYRIYRMAKDAGADFNSVAIPPDFDHAYKEKFDLEYQRALFEEGVRIGKRSSGARSRSMSRTIRRPRRHAVTQARAPGNAGSPSRGSGST